MCGCYGRYLLGALIAGLGWISVDDVGKGGGRAEGGVWGRVGLG